LRIPDQDNKQRKVILLMWLGVDRRFRGRDCDDGARIASKIFATTENEARASPKARPDMPVALEVEVGNDHAREVYAHWEFEYVGQRDAKGTDRKYEVMLRSATASEPEGSDAGEAAARVDQGADG
jgi:hypothetical protein